MIRQSAMSQVPIDGIADLCVLDSVDRDGEQAGRDSHRTAE